MIKRLVPKSKKGEDIVRDEFIKLFIAILCIGALFILGYKMYGLLSTKSGLEQAKSTLDAIVNEIKQMKDGEIRTILIESPDGWYIVGLDVNGKNKLCICETVSTSTNTEESNKEQITYCSQSGICEEFEKKINLPSLDRISTYNPPFAVKVRVGGLKINLGVKGYIGLSMADSVEESEKKAAEALESDPADNAN